ncbi:hypothetical protein BHE74_00007486 [Ensete ventricosum]|nr:hypothetical protein BHE74_00007486 [Ensete ventricosum]
MLLLKDLRSGRRGVEKEEGVTIAMQLQKEQTTGAIYSSLVQVAERRKEISSSGRPESVTWQQGADFKCRRATVGILMMLLLLYEMSSSRSKRRRCWWGEDGLLALKVDSGEEVALDLRGLPAVPVVGTHEGATGELEREAMVPSKEAPLAGRSALSLSEVAKADAIPDDQEKKNLNITDLESTMASKELIDAKLEAFETHMKDKLRALFAKFSFGRRSSPRRSQQDESYNRREDSQEKGGPMTDPPYPRMRVDFPRWEEACPIGWISRVEYYFRYHKTSDTSIVDITAIQIEGDAIQ